MSYDNQQPNYTYKRYETPLADALRKTTAELHSARELRMQEREGAARTAQLWEQAKYQRVQAETLREFMHQQKDIYARERAEGILNDFIDGLIQWYNITPKQTPGD